MTASHNGKQYIPFTPLPPTYWTTATRAQSATNDCVNVAAARHSPTERPGAANTSAATTASGHICGRNGTQTGELIVNNG